MRRLLIFCVCLVIIGFFLISQKIGQEPTLETLLDKSTKHVGVPYPHNLGFMGDGIKVAVIDTGIDYNHPDLFGFGPNGKIIGGYDFIDNDDSPLDTNGHGTEVAGIIAADGSLKGIAPHTKILAYRVSDTGNSVSSDLIIKAVERAIEDDADIINISLGVNRTNDRIEDSINHAIRKGIVVVVAAGNGGPDLKTIGSPGKDPHAITVGATYNNITASLVATLQVDGKRMQVLPMVGTEQLTGPITSEIVFGKYGRQGDLKDIDATGKILLVERGSDREGELVYFSQKEKNSASSGAKALIVYNNEPGMFLGDLRNKLEDSDYKPRIPAVSLSREDGLLLKTLLVNKTVGMLNTFYHPDFVSFFSSRGPVFPFYIKPDLVAPGVFVNTTTIDGLYNLTSGTSFAAPHVSGASAILLQKNPTLKPQEISAIISTTSDPISDTFGTPFPQEISGTGRLNVTKAFDANLVILPPFGIFDLSPYTKTKTATFEIKTLDNKKPEIKVDFEFEQDIVKFDYFFDGSELKVTATLVNQRTGQHQGMMIINDQKTKYYIPILVRVSEGSVKVIENNGKLDFSIDLAQAWSYAKISIYNTDARLVDGVSITPSGLRSVLLYDVGTFWVQAEIKTENETVNLYNTVRVKTPAEPGFDLANIYLPTQQFAIIIAIMTIVLIVGLYFRRGIIA
jgi:minor extracellular serine protease Vpr